MIRVGQGAKRLLVYSLAVDMRKSFDGLIALTRSVLRSDPLSGDVYIFVNRGQKIAKLLMWERTGYVVVAKRLERTRFRMPERGESFEFSERELELFLDGMLK